ncbi:TPA: hypothetical protein N0F65_006935, partial [Lagenidium giganteum]
SDASVSRRGATRLALGSVHAMASSNAPRSHAFDSRRSRTGAHQHNGSEMKSTRHRRHVPAAAPAASTLVDRTASPTGVRATTMASPRGVKATPWKDTDRIAQFIANLAGGCFVLLGVTSYVLRAIRQSLADSPNVREYLWLHVMKWTPAVSPCWLSNGGSFWTKAQECALLAVAQAQRVQLDLSDPLVLSAWISGLTMLSVLVLAMRKYKWLGWFLGVQFVVIIQWFVALYQVFRILLSMTLFAVVKVWKWSVVWSRNVHATLFQAKNKQAEALRVSMKRAMSYVEWANMAKTLDILEDKEHWKKTVLPEDQEHCDFKQLAKNVDKLAQAIDTKSIDEIKYILAAFVMRDKLGTDSPMLHLECSHGTKHLITKYNELVIQALELLHNAGPGLFPPTEKTTFFKKLKQSFGSTALCLSGGGAIAMYHMGVIRALLEADLLPNVVSGSSGGSIAAAMTACKTNEELLNDIVQNDISTRFIPWGIRWFPPLLDQLAHCIKTGFLVECSDFERTTQQYYGEPLNSQEKMMHYTFQDAYRKTGRHVCITVSASDVTGQRGPKKLLLSHINSPHVLLWSAVAVSCSLPGIMKGKQLMARDHEGNIVPYTSLGQEWMDGSIQHDLPMETMASCFNVTNFIVSQVNPPVVPFVSEAIDNPKFRNSVFHMLESVIAADVRHRLKMLAFLGLFPRIYGHQFSSMFRQNFSGNVTIVPDFIFAEAIGIKAILNPTVEDMDRYILGGQRAVWPKLEYIRHLCSVEKSIDQILEQLLGPSVSPYKNWLNPLSTLVAAIEENLQRKDEKPLQHKTELQELLREFPSDSEELAPFAQFDASRNYTRNLISTDHETYALMLICWNKGKYSPIHDHPSDGCWVKVIQGEVNEVRYKKSDTKLIETSNVVLTDGVTYMDDSLGLHKVGNPNHELDAITMHLYSPPYEKCRIWFDPEHAEKSSIAVSNYYTEFGQKVEF